MRIEAHKEAEPARGARAEWCTRSWAAAAPYTQGKKVRKWLETFQEIPGSDLPVDAKIDPDKEGDGNTSKSSRELGGASLVVSEAENNLLSGLLPYMHPFACLLDGVQKCMHASGSLVWPRIGMLPFLLLRHAVRCLCMEEVDA
eukprot:1128963-Pelagomonas_calceolata.AAC.4